MKVQQGPKVQQDRDNKKKKEIWEEVGGKVLLVTREQGKDSNVDALQVRSD